MTVLFLRGFYPFVREVFERKAEGKNTDELHKIANELIFDIQRAISVYLRGILKKRWGNVKFIDIFSNCPRVQRRWEKEFYPETDRIVKELSDVKPSTDIDFWATPDSTRILAKQILFYKPDLIINLAVDFVPPELFRKAKKYVKFKLIGGYGGTLLKIKDASCYDAFFSPYLPNILRFRRISPSSKTLLLDHGFDDCVLERLKDTKKRFAIVFSGSLHSIHKSRMLFLLKVAKYFGRDFVLFTQSTLSVPEPLSRFVAGKVFGIEHMKVLANSHVSLNHHGDIIPWAHNVRLFESTGVGTTLVTDDLPNLSNLFEPQKEVLCFRDAEEGIEKIKFALENPDKAKKIADAGRKRTLSKHLYRHRMEELFKLIRRVVEEKVE